MLIPLGKVNTDSHLTLRTGDQKLVLSQKLFDRENATQHIAAAIERLRAGLPLEDPTSTKKKRRKRDKYDEQLDRELAALDL